MGFDTTNTGPGQAGPASADGPAEASSGRTFFRQSGWMMLTTVVSGLAFYAVHLFGKKIPDAEYGALGLLLAVLNCLSIPSLGLQMVFAQQAASAVDSRRREVLSGTARGVLLGLFLIWLVALVIVAVFHERLLTRWQLSNSAGLWLMLVVGLLTMCSPVFSGLLQGQQNFLWLGWSSMLNSIGRLLAVAIIVLIFQGQAAGMAGGILIGVLVSVWIGAVCTRKVWLGPGPCPEPVEGASVDWRKWLTRVVPLTIGFGSFQFMFSVDPLFVQAWFDKDLTGYYTAAGTLARALVVFTGPIVVVMFPKVVRSAALSTPTTVMKFTLLITAGLAGFAALCISVIGPPLVVLIYKDTYRAAAPLLPWFAFGMLPLALANVLLNDLMAKSRFAVVPWLAAWAGAYVLALYLRHATFVEVIQTLGVFNLGFLSILGLFSWRHEARPPSRG